MRQILAGALERGVGGGAQLRLELIERGLHAVQQHLILVGLEDVADRVALKGLIGIGELGVSGQEDGLAGGPAPVHLLEQIQAVHVRHVDVGHHQVDPVALEHLQRPFAAIGAENLDRYAQSGGKQPLDALRDDGFVVHNQQVILRVHVRPPPFVCF